MAQHITLQHQNSDRLVQTVKVGWSWPCFFFGCFWFLAKGMVGKAVVFFILAFVTLGISWIIVPAFANKMLLEHYLSLGYKEVSGK